MGTIYTVYHIKRKDMAIDNGYIGVTCNYKIRRRQHLYNLKRNKHVNPHLQHAFNKYKDVEFCILHEFTEKEYAYMAEAFYRPLPSIGWNLRAGGHIQNKLDENTISKLRKANSGPNCNFYGKTGKNNHNAVEVYCTELQQTFSTIKEASETTGISASNIVRVCIGERKTAGGYTWKYTNMPTKTYKIRTISKTPKGAAKKVLNIDTNTVYNSLEGAAHSAGLKSITGIVMVCNNKRKLAGGYRWKYYKD